MISKFNEYNNQGIEDYGKSFLLDSFVIIEDLLGIKADIEEFICKENGETWVWKSDLRSISKSQNIYAAYSIKIVYKSILDSNSPRYIDMVNVDSLILLFNTLNKIKSKLEANGFLFLDSAQVVDRSLNQDGGGFVFKLYYQDKIYREAI